MSASHRRKSGLSAKSLKSWVLSRTIPSTARSVALSDSTRAFFLSEFRRAFLNRASLATAPGMSTVAVRMTRSGSPHSIPPNRSLNSSMIADSRSVSISPPRRRSARIPALTTFTLDPHSQSSAGAGPGTESGPPADMAQRAMENRVDRKAVESWIADFGLQSQPHPQHDAEFEWGLMVGGQAFTTIVAQRRSDFNYLAIQATVGVSTDHQAVVRALDRESRATFLFDLRLALHSQSVGHSIELDGAVAENQPDLPVQVTVGTNLTQEQIRRADFFKANHAIQTGASIVALMFQRLALRKKWP